MDEFDLKQRRDNLSPAKRALLEKRLRGSSARRSDPATIPHRTVHSAAPLSFAQQGLWLLDQLEPGDPFYNAPIAFRLEGALDISALEYSVNEIVRRHEILRTRFVVDGLPVQVVSP